MSEVGKFRLSVIGGMNIDGDDRIGAFLSGDPSALRGIAALFGDDVSIVAAHRITALEAQVAAADRLAEAWAEFDKPLLKFGSFNGMRKTARENVAAYRAAKGE